MKKIIKHQRIQLVQRNYCINNNGNNQLAKTSGDETQEAGLQGWTKPFQIF